MKFQAIIGKDEHNVEVANEGDYFDIIIDGDSYPVHLVYSDASHGVILYNNKCYDVMLSRKVDGYLVQVIDQAFDIKISDPRKKALHPSSLEEGGKKVLKAQMPGRIVKILVKQGDPVEEGAGIVVLEAMKMQNEIKAPKSGQVKEIGVKENEAVETGQVLAVIE